MPRQDDGGIGANLVSMDQMAKNLVRNTSDTAVGQDQKKKDDDAIRKLDDIAGLSPEAAKKQDRTSVNRPFDLSNQLKELKSNALEHRSHTASRKGSFKSNSSQPAQTPLKVAKPLGKMKERDSTGGGLKSDRSQLTADIIVYKSLTPEEDKKKRHHSKEEIKRTNAAEGVVGGNGKEGDELDGV